MKGIALAGQAFAFVTCVALAMISERASAATNVRVEGDTVVIHVPIQIVTAVEDDEFKQQLADLEREVEAIWNRAFEGFSYDCWKFRLDLELVHALPGSPAQEGYHVVESWPTRWIPDGVALAGWYTQVINVPNYKFHPDDDIPHRDFEFPYKGEMGGVFYTLDARVFAHEIGHVMGLGDDYYKKGGYKPEGGGIGERAGGVVFSGTFMTSGVGGPEPVHLWRAVAMMKQAGVLPPCPCASGVRWNGTMHEIHSAGAYDRHSTEVKVQLCEKRLDPLLGPPIKGMVDFITLEDAGSILTRRHWAEPGTHGCTISGQGVSSAQSPAGGISRTLEDIGRRGELRWSAWTYYVNLAPTKSPDYTVVCHYATGTQRNTYEGGKGSWSVNSGPAIPLPLDGGRMVGSYRDGLVNFVSWSICRDGVACAPAPGNPSPQSNSDSRQTGGPPPGGPNSAPAAPTAASAPAAQAPPTPNPPKGRGSGLFRP
jgi:hypothetical protein